MMTIFVARYLPGVGVSRLFYGKPAMIAGNDVEWSGRLAMGFQSDQCFGVLWYWRMDERPIRVAAIGRCAQGARRPIQLPGIAPHIELRVLVEQTGAAGSDGPVDEYVAAAETAGDHEAAIPDLSSTDYFQLRTRIDVSSRTLRHMRKVFGCPRHLLNISGLCVKQHGNKTLKGRANDHGERNPVRLASPVLLKAVSCSQRYESIDRGPAKTSWYKSLP